MIQIPELGRTGSIIPLTALSPKGILLCQISRIRMNRLSSVFAVTFVLTVLALIGWEAVWGVGYVRGVLAPIGTSTMAVVVAAWIGVWGAAAIIAVGLRWAHGREADVQRRETRADVYGYLLDAWANAAVLGPVPSDAPKSAQEARADLAATLDRAERHLALHGSSRVIDAYDDLSDPDEGGEQPLSDDALDHLLKSMRRDLGHSTLDVRTESLRELLDPHTDIADDGRSKSPSPIK